jgi:hypothetical protein
VWWHQQKFVFHSWFSFTQGFCWIANTESIQNSLSVYDINLVRQKKKAPIVFTILGKLRSILKIHVVIAAILFCSYHNGKKYPTRWEDLSCLTNFFYENWVNLLILLANMIRNLKKKHLFMRTILFVTVHSIWGSFLHLFFAEFQCEKFSGQSFSTVYARCKAFLFFTQVAIFFCFLCTIW